MNNRGSNNLFLQTSAAILASYQLLGVSAVEALPPGLYGPTPSGFDNVGSPSRTRPPFDMTVDEVIRLQKKRVERGQCASSIRPILIILFVLGLVSC